MRARHLFLLVAALSCARLLAIDPLYLDVLGLTDGIVSKKSKSVAVVVTNQTPDDRTIKFIAISVERKEKDGKFYEVRTDIDCPCNAKCCGPERTIKKNEVIQAKWDFRYGDCHVGGSGIYRFAIIERFSDATEGYVYHGASKEFTITE